MANRQWRGRRWLVVGCLAAIAAAPARSWADGGLIISEEVSVEEVPGGTQAEAALSGMVSSTDQRAVFWLDEDDGCWDMFVDPGTIEVSGAAWIMPLPVRPRTIESASAEFIDQLDAATMPLLLTTYTRIIEHYRYVDSGGGSSGIGCMGSADLANGEEEVYDGSETVDEGSDSDVVEPPVDVWARGRLGSVEYEVIEADEAAALMIWLEDNGYVVPEGIEPLLGEYVAEGQLFFVARLSREPGDGEGVPVFRFELCDLVMPDYPIRLSQMSVSGSLAFTLWFIFPSSIGGVTSTNTEVANFNLLHGTITETTDGGPPQDFEQLYLDYRELIHDLDGGRGLAVEYSWMVNEASVAQRIEHLGSEALPEDRSQWSPELEQVVDTAPQVLRLSGDFPVSQMDEDVEFGSGTLLSEPAVFEREVVTYEQEYSWDDGSDSTEAPEGEPIFDDASCAVTDRRRGDGRSLPIAALLLVAALLVFRRAGRNGRRC